MCGNINRKPIGRCSQCGGVVSIPTVWWSVNRPVASCEQCGAVANEAANLPIIPTKPVKRESYKPLFRGIKSAQERKNMVEM